MLSRILSELLQIIGQVFAFDRGYTLVQGQPLNSGPRNLSSLTRNIALSYGIDIFKTIISFCHNACVWQTDRRTDRKATIVRCALKWSHIAGRKPSSKHVRRTKPERFESTKQTMPWLLSVRRRSSGCSRITSEVGVQQWATNTTAYSRRQLKAEGQISC